MTGLFLAAALLAAPGSAQEEHVHAGMPPHGLYGPYAIHREASGTSWEPDSTPMEGWHGALGDWSLMTHGFANLAYDRQGGPRGGEKLFSASMGMAVGQRPLGPGTLGLRGMASLDPLMGPSGYPLLLQAGETANGRDPLIDRQHPHDLFMELAASYSWQPGPESSLFAYFGLPGEPALGPPVYMHRWSGSENPEAPLTHHWIDSTHVSFGVATLGAVWRDFKLEGSVFNGREPDEHRWDIESPRFDSTAARLSWNPDRRWALQASAGHLISPEQLSPGVDQDRATASASYSGRLGSAPWQVTAAGGRIWDKPGRRLDGLLLEGRLSLPTGLTVFGRAERVERDDLFAPGEPLSGEVFTVGKLTLGGVYDFMTLGRARLGLGGLASAAITRAGLDPSYGKAPASFMLWLRVKLI